MLALAEQKIERRLTERGTVWGARTGKEGAVLGRAQTGDSSWQKGAAAAADKKKPGAGGVWLLLSRAPLASLQTASAGSDVMDWGLRRVSLACG